MIKYAVRIRDEVDGLICYRYLNSNLLDPSGDWDKAQLFSAEESAKSYAAILNSVDKKRATVIEVKIYEPPCPTS